MRTLSRAVLIFLSVWVTAALTAAGFLWFAAGEIYDYNDTFDLNRAGKVDVVICLAGGKNRIPIAAAIWEKIKSKQGGQAPVLFFSGVGPYANLSTLIEQGVPTSVVSQIKREDVVFENVSENTFENAQLFSSFVRQKGWRSIVLVTANYHMRRAEFILRKVLGPEAEIYSSTVDAAHFRRNEWHSNAYAIRVTLIEYIKWLYYRYTY